MKNKWKSFLMNPWTVTIGGGLILSVIISVINDFIKKEEIFSTISVILLTIYKKILLILNYRIKVWWLILGVIALVCIFFLFVMYLDHTQPTSNKSEFLEYTQDTILGYKWKWNWQKDIYGKYCVENLYPVCSRCDTPLVENFYGYGGKYKCLRCEEGYSKPLPDYQNVKMLIHDNVRRKYFPND